MYTVLYDTLLGPPLVPHTLNPFTTGNPFLGTNLLGFSIGRGSGALKKGLTHRYQTLFIFYSCPKHATRSTVGQLCSTHATTIEAAIFSFSSALNGVLNVDGGLKRLLIDPKPSGKSSLFFFLHA